MKFTVKQVLGVLITTAMLLISNHGLAQEPSQAEPTSEAKQESSPPAPDLADFVPLAAALAGRLTALEKALADLLDVASVELKYEGLKADLEDPVAQLQQLKDSKEYKYTQLVELKKAIGQENVLFEKISEPLSDSIHQLEAWREEWQAEKKRWNEWQSALLKEGEPGQLKSTVEKANNTIDKALNLVLTQLEAMLRVQEKAGNIHAKISAFTAELDALILKERRGALLSEYPPMFSSEYFTQLSSSELRYTVQKRLQEISWPDREFFAQRGWIVLLHGLLALYVIIAVYRNRQKLAESERWRFLAARPFSTGLFFGTITVLVIYEYEGASAIWKLINMILGGISFARVFAGFAETSWKRQSVYGLMVVLIGATLMDVLSFPLPLFRLYTFSTSLLGLLLCLRWAKESSMLNDSGLYARLLRLAALSFAVVVIAELWGKKALASYLFFCLMDSIATALVFMLFVYMIHGGLEWLLRTSALRRVPLLREDESDGLLRRVTLLVDVAVWVLIFLPAILMIWGIYDSLAGATKGLLALGFNLGSQRISVGLLLVSAGIVYGAFLISWIFRKLLMDEALVRRRVERGVRVSIGRLIHYVLIVIGFLFAFSMLGFEITKITIMLSALGVGIGFGLQNVVNNFVSGLILLFEQPVRVGDLIEIGGQWSEIKRIGIRATVVQTLDQADLIVPNADLINNQVTNWTLSSRQVRLIIPVGVAYGSDVPLVMETLNACAKSHELVTETPMPIVLFLGFGESSLDFELRVWVLDADRRLEVKSKLNQEIDRSFREAKIEIAFPQRDLHLRSVDESVVLRTPETTV